MRNAIGISLLLSLLVNILFFYRVVDLGVTTTYESDEISQREKQVNDLQKLLPILVDGMSRSVVFDIANKAGLEVMEKREEGIYVGSLLFKFYGDKVQSVEFR